MLQLAIDELAQIIPKNSLPVLPLMDVFRKNICLLYKKQPSKNVIELWTGLFLAKPLTINP